MRVCADKVDAKATGEKVQQFDETNDAAADGDVENSAEEPDQVEPRQHDGVLELRHAALLEGDMNNAESSRVQSLARKPNRF